MVHIDNDRAAFAQRLVLAADKAGLPARGRGAQIAQHLGVTPKAVSKYFNAEAIPSREMMIALANMLGVSVSWLQFGEREFDVVSAQAPLRTIPVIDYVQAGVWNDTASSYSLEGGFGSISTDIPVGRGAFALRIKGHSMAPELLPGDVVIVDPEASPQPGEFVVLKTNEPEVSVAQYRPKGMNEHGKMWFELMPLNPVYPTFRSDIQELQIIGVIVERRRYTRITP